MQKKIQNISPVKRRILSFAQTLGISKREFYTTIGVSRGTLESKTGITEDVVAKFIARYPQVNIEWLVTGEGEMYKTKRISDETPQLESVTALYKDSDYQTDSQIKSSDSGNLKPRIPFEAAAGSLSFAVEGTTIYDCEMLPVIPNLPKYDFTIIARGDSMTPDIYSGDELACRFVDNSSFIQWGRTYVLDTAQGVVVKKIFDSSDDILCRSSNSDYPDFHIPKTEIYHIALVVGLVRQI